MLNRLSVKLTHAYAAPPIYLKCNSDLGRRFYFRFFIQNSWPKRHKSGCTLLLFARYRCVPTHTNSDFAHQHTFPNTSMYNEQCITLRCVCLWSPGKWQERFCWTCSHRDLMFTVHVFVICVCLWVRQNASFHPRHKQAVTVVRWISKNMTLSRFDKKDVTVGKNMFS